MTSFRAFVSVSFVASGLTVSSKSGTDPTRKESEVFVDLKVLTMTVSRQSFAPNFAEYITGSFCCYSFSFDILCDTKQSVVNDLYCNWVSVSHIQQKLNKTQCITVQNYLRRNLHAQNFKHFSHLLKNSRATGKLEVLPGYFLNLQHISAC